jgi:DNA-binding NarL/FixJ family response regulator
MLVDDHAVVRDGLQLLLEAHDGIRVVGNAADAQTALRLVEALHPKVVVMDIALPGMNGIDATRAIRHQSPDTQVIMLSMHSTPDYLYQALSAGACGYVLKEVAGNEVVDAVRAAARGEQYFSRKITDLLVAAFLKQYQPSPSNNPFDMLSPREAEILKRVIAGQSSKEIAVLLCLSPKTVETYRSRLMEKLDVHDIPSLVKLGILHGVDSPR